MRAKPNLIIAHSALPAESETTGQHLWMQFMLTHELLYDLERNRKKEKKSLEIG